MGSVIKWQCRAFLIAMIQRIDCFTFAVEIFTAIPTFCRYVFRYYRFILHLFQSMIWIIGLSVNLSCLVYLFIMLLDVFLRLIAIFKPIIEIVTKFLQNVHIARVRISPCIPSLILTHLNRSSCTVLLIFLILTILYWATICCVQSWFCVCIAN